jgi:hypothetical protein
MKQPWVLVIEEDVCSMLLSGQELRIRRFEIETVERRPVCHLAGSPKPRTRGRQLGNRRPALKREVMEPHFGRKRKKERETRTKHQEKKGEKENQKKRKEKERKKEPGELAAA